MKNGKLSILLLTEDFPPLIGGVATFLHHICLSSKENISVLAFGVAGDDDRDRSVPYKIDRIRLRPHLGMLIVFFKTLQAVLKKKPNIILWGDYSPAIVMTLLLRPFLGVGVTMLVHGTRFNVSRAIKPLGRILSTLILRKCDLIFANSEYTKSKLLNLGALDKKVKVLYPGVDVKRFRPDISFESVAKKYGLSGRRIILTVARLVEKKNHGMVLKIVSAIAKKIPDLLYLIAGDGQERENLERLVEHLAIDQYVRFVPSPLEDEYPLLYNLCDVFVMPNRVSYVPLKTGSKVEDAETFGMVFCEANACGKSVIGGRSGGVPEAVIDGTTGILVDPENEQEVKDALLKLLLNREMATALGKNGRDRVVREFAWDRVAEKFDNEMERCLVEKASRMHQGPNRL